MKYAKINPARDLLVPDFECYQMDLSGPVNAAIAAGEVDAEFKTLPSWAKFAKNPQRAKGFFVRMLQAVFLGIEHAELNTEDQIEVGVLEARIAMMFLPANIRKDCLLNAGKIAEQTLSGYEVVVLSGANGTTNHNAQQKTNEAISKGKPVLILAAQIAQRSYSIPEMTELYLAYDEGQEGATLQKMSRVLTPHNLDKIGRVFSLSFDPNRDDKFDAMIVETALNNKMRGSKTSLLDSLKDVLRTINIFKATPDGRVKINADTYLETAMARKGISRVLGKMADITKLSDDDIWALSQGECDYTRADKQAAAQRGKTKDTKPALIPTPKNASTNDFEKAKARVREMIVMLLDNIDVILCASGKMNLDEAMSTLAADVKLKQGFSNTFGIPLEVAQRLVSTGAINNDHISLLFRG